MSRVDKPKYGIKYWKPGQAPSVIWLANQEAQDRKIRSLKRQGYQTQKRER